MPKNIVICKVEDVDILLVFGFWGEVKRSMSEE